ncbi:hypothetical protein [Lactobacillus sp. ESL0791]|uniref:hypothetical protein n=1 Tax=Lactobacillus sp. ESL0791 TaxID=2983234 RepID=UPI0035ABDFE0
MNGGNVAKCLQEQADKSFKQERVSRVDKRIKLQRKGLKDNYYEIWQSSFGESQKHHYFLEGLKHGGQKIGQSECII